jgi:hypothetical protein
MENNQTEHIPDVGKTISSIDWLIKQMSLEDVCKYSNELAEAKEMRMQELKHAYEAEQNNCRGIFKYESFEHYYRENYGK